MVAAAQTIDPFLSWTEGTAKQSTINLVTKVDEGRLARRCAACRVNCGVTLKEVY